jgi:hypothetical protein
MSAATLLTVAPRFCGPPQSANGGYMAALVAALAPQIVTVRLRRPPPLGVGMLAEPQADGRILVSHAGQLIAEARPAGLELDVPTVPGYDEAVQAARHYAGFRRHAFPGCFVCGPQRARGDGLRIFAGPLAAPSSPAPVPSAAGATPGIAPATPPQHAAQLVAAPWVPEPCLDAGDGKVAAEFMWAALDCPGYFASRFDGQTALLAEFTAHVDRRVHIGEPCIVLGWPLAIEGRTHLAGTAIVGRGGDVCARARASWVVPTAAT